jgi:hypothetical protein
MLALLIVVIVVRNGGVFQNAMQAIQGAAASGPAQSVQTSPTSLDNAGGSSSGGSSGGSALGTAASIIGGIAAIF